MEIDPYRKIEKEKKKKKKTTTKKKEKKRGENDYTVESSLDPKYVLLHRRGQMRGRRLTRKERK